MKIVKSHLSGKQIAYSVKSFKTKRMTENYERKNNAELDGRILTSDGKTKLKDACTLLYLESVKQKQTLTFWTFTIPPTDNVLPDKVYTKRWSMLLENLKKNYGLHECMWVAEIQHQRWKKYNQRYLHYHAVFSSDFPIDVQKVRAAWSKHMAKLHYDKAITTAWVKVKPIYNVITLASYMTKYITKNQDIFYCQPYFITQSLLSRSRPVQKKDFIKGVEYKEFQKPIYTDASGNTHSVLVRLHTLTQYLDKNIHQSDFDYNIPDEQYLYDLDLLDINNPNESCEYLMTQLQANTATFDTSDAVPFPEY